MTKAEEAALRGQIVALKILFGNCLAFIAGNTNDPDAHLETIKTEAFDGIAKMPSVSGVHPQHLRVAQEAAAGLVDQAIQNARAAIRLARSQGHA